MIDNDLSNYKKEAIKQIRRLCSTLNEAQANIVISLINKCDSLQEVLDIKNLFLNQIKFGLVFDFAPDEDDISSTEISLLQKDEKWSFVGENTNNIIQDSREREREREHLINNTLIIGDNFDALKNLLITNIGQIDVIYIDPPYNTGGTNLGYKDKFGKDAWLSLMYERLEYARLLLKDDGVIFVSIDDNMQAYLKIIMDEIFGEENFVGNIFWQNTTGANDTLFFKKTVEYVMCYSKNINQINIRKKLQDIQNDKSYQFSDEYIETRGKYKLTNLDNASHTWSQGLDYEYQYDGVFYYPGGSKESWKERQNGKHAIKDWRWMWSKKKLEWGINSGFIVFKNNRIYQKRYQFVDNNDKQIERSELFKDFISVNEISNLYGTQEQKDIFGHKVFDHPKPTKLLKYLINLCINSNAIVLDFFAGSGTTGEAVLELNKEDGGNRKYILCTIEKDQDLNVADICYERLYRINHGYGTNKENIDAWLKKHEPYKQELNVYRIVKENVSLDSIDALNFYDFACYKELNTELDLNNKNFKDELFSLTKRNWWFS